MSFLATALSGVKDPQLQEELQERADLVAHKIKFMDLVPVCLLDTSNSPAYQLSEVLQFSGAFLEPNPDGAVFLIYHQENRDLTALMREVPAMLLPGWGAVQNNRVILMDIDAYRWDNAEGMLELIEDLAEMTHPGHFIFGKEGDKWIRFEL
ncbi:hypothetical protein C7T94_18740 [Pedobacter yulinensis]|uniref:Fe/B12 periplasmic-binding domain-containing protein n=1 Tax=Pedobacter yulinensis TaxID=2126353 RepID=A0A2T3HGV3_9SPHI|nr:hypothetical protein [Pedobacter yulinensis]PST81652.1 hypothetical protein C7T94_18740 [Pedobacter yulinensis]